MAFTELFLAEHSSTAFLSRFDQDHEKSLAHTVSLAGSEHKHTGLQTCRGKKENTPWALQHFTALVRAQCEGQWIIMLSQGQSGTISLERMPLYGAERGTTTPDWGYNNLYNEMSPDIIRDHIPTAREGLPVQSRELGAFLSAQLMSEEVLFDLWRKNLQDQRSVALGNINAHNEKKRESPKTLLQDEYRGKQPIVTFYRAETSIPFLPLQLIPTWLLEWPTGCSLRQYGPSGWKFWLCVGINIKQVLRIYYVAFISYFTWRIHNNPSFYCF